MTKPPPLAGGDDARLTVVVITLQEIVTTGINWHIPRRLRQLPPPSPQRRQRPIKKSHRWLRCEGMSGSFRARGSKPSFGTIMRCKAYLPQRLRGRSTCLLRNTRACCGRAIQLLVMLLRLRLRCSQLRRCCWALVPAHNVTLCHCGKASLRWTYM